MNFTRSIYYNDKPLILTTDLEGYISSNPRAENYSFYDGAILRSFTQAIQQLDRPGTTGAIIEDVSEHALLSQLYAMYIRIDAGGGLVYNELGELLMIFRKGKWDLPKGKLDHGETISECALREVQEETGLTHLVLGTKICDTYHIYAEKGKQIIKVTAWYKMAGMAGDKLSPQKEENILEARWVSPQDLPPLAAKSYYAIRELLDSAALRNS